MTEDEEEPLSDEERLKLSEPLSDEEQQNLSEMLSELTRDSVRQHRRMRRQAPLRTNELLQQLLQQLDRRLGDAESAMTSYDSLFGQLIQIRGIAFEMRDEARNRVFPFVQHLVFISISLWIIVLLLGAQVYRHR